MINSDPPLLPDPVTGDPPPPGQVTRIARGALLLACVAVLVVMGIWFAFYMLVFLPRGSP